MILLSPVLVLLAFPALAATAYLAVLTVLSRRTRPPLASARRLRFDVVVPAHDEEAGIKRTVRNLRSLDWPRDRFRVLVVADNCSDRTAERAEAAGATVLVRRDRTRRGKGYALKFAFERVLSDGFADAAVVVDADSVASPNLLSAFAARLEAGELAVQSVNSVLNHDASWRTRLMALAFVLFNDVRSLGRARLGVSCGLRGNGMCITREALTRVPQQAFSIVEDLEYGICLGLAGIRVAYAHEASVKSEMISSESASRSQRRRWEAGRIALMRVYGTDLLVAAIRGRSLLLLDLALDVLMPPLSWIVVYTGLGTSAAGMMMLANAAPPMALAVWLLPCGFLAAYVLRGAVVSAMGLRGLAALAWAPAFIAWKFAVLITCPPQQSANWVRTAREPQTHSTFSDFGRRRPGTRGEVLLPPPARRDPDGLSGIR